MSPYRQFRSQHPLRRGISSFGWGTPGQPCTSGLPLYLCVSSVEVEVSLSLSSWEPLWVFSHPGKMRMFTCALHFQETQIPQALPKHIPLCLLPALERAREEMKSSLLIDIPNIREWFSWSFLCTGVKRRNPSYLPIINGEGWGLLLPGTLYSPKSHTELSTDPHFLSSPQCSLYKYHPGAGLVIDYRMDTAAAS